MIFDWIFWIAMCVRQIWISIILLLAVLIYPIEGISMSNMYGSCGTRPFGPASAGTQSVGPTFGQVVTFHADQTDHDYVHADTGIYDTDIDCWLILKGQPNTAGEPTRRMSISWRGDFSMVGYGGDNYVDTTCDRALVEVYDASDDGLTLTNRLAFGCGTNPPAESFTDSEAFVVHLYVAAKPPDINYTEVIPFPRNNASCGNTTVEVCALNQTSCEIDCACQIRPNTTIAPNTTVTPNITTEATTAVTTESTTAATTESTVATTVVTTDANVTTANVTNATTEATTTMEITTVMTTVATTTVDLTTLAPCVQQLNITNSTVVQPFIRFTFDFTSYFQANCSTDGINDAQQMQCDSGRCIDDTLRCDVYSSPNCGTGDDSDIRDTAPGFCIVEETETDTLVTDLLPLYIILGLLALLAMLYWCCWRPGYIPWRLARCRNVRCCKRPCCHPCRTSPACRQTGCCGGPATGACAVCSPTCCTGAPGPGGGGGCLGPCSRLPCCTGGPGGGNGGPGAGPKKGACGCCVPLNGSLATSNGEGWGPSKTKAGGKGGGLGPNGWYNFSNDDGAHIRETR